ncbi:MAG: hypothetical protein Q9168_001293 [Polycauliona sp. 1 TL-2023]
MAGKKKNQKKEKSTFDLLPSSPSNQLPNVYTSPPFKFIVEGTAFYLHAALVSQHSKPLDRMMNGEMSEAQKGYATLEDVGEDTFGRFAEWVNKGYYTPGKAFKRSLDPFDQGESIEEDRETGEPKVPLTPIMDCTGPSNAWGYRSRYQERPPSPYMQWGVHQPFGTKSEASRRSQLKQSFVHGRTAVGQSSTSIPPPHPNQGPDEDYSDVFLSHAQLYVFAERYDIRILKTLALENLRDTLAVFTLHKECTGDIIALLQYGYANTIVPSAWNEDLRTLLTHYMGYEMDTLMTNEGFRDLMVEDGGPLLGDFMTMVKRRIS